MKSFLTALALVAGLAPATASAFDFSFTWDGLVTCTGGRPGFVGNPAFYLRQVPRGTRFIKFEMKDLDAPAFIHGGGTINYTGQHIVQGGVFTYRGPCPPEGTHTYEWTATAMSGRTTGILGRARVQRSYPD